MDTHTDANVKLLLSPRQSRGITYWIYGAKADLDALLGRRVDLVEPAAVRNPYVLASINSSREPVYAA